MNTIFFTLKCFLVRLSRFHHRCGYGVHSPFAFDFITEVIYQKKFYSVYKELKVEEKKQMGVNHKKGWVNESRKVNRLLFRLVNQVQPCTIVDVGNLSCSALYLQSGKPSADYIPASDLTDLFLEKGVPVDFLYLHDHKNPVLTEQIFRVCAARSHKQSVFAIRGIGYSNEMKTLWRRLIDNEEVGVTFDLHDLGILFFDKTKVKQHYKVCF
jgi:hypothetical protein